jgi:methylated-DNA-[protein]-cysteine S-methyltransferase
LDWDGAAYFNRADWGELVKIPNGRTTSYSAIAEKIGNPTAVRAVGLANRNNPIAIIVPCHRVIAKSGDLHGYFYGLDMKRRLLELENPMSFARQGSLF